MQFSEEQRDSGPVFLPFGLKSYLELVDWSGRAKRADKSGHIEAKQPKLLSALRLNAQQWKLLSQEIQKEAATMLHGLNKVAVIERRGQLKAVA